MPREFRGKQKRWLWNEVFRKAFRDRIKLTEIQIKCGSYRENIPGQETTEAKARKWERGSVCR